MTMFRLIWKCLFLLFMVIPFLLLFKLILQQATNERMEVGHRNVIVSETTMRMEKLEELRKSKPIVNSSSIVNNMEKLEELRKSKPIVNSSSIVNNGPAVQIANNTNQRNAVDFKKFINEDMLKGVIKVLNEDIYILSAVARINHPHRNYSDIVLLGWDGRQNKKRNIKMNPFCCHFVYTDERMLTVGATSSPPNELVTRLSAEKFVCQLPEGQPSYVLLEKCDINLISHSNVTKICDNECLVRRKYLQVIYPEFHEGKLAICTKIIYGKIDIQVLVEWFEMQKLLGVHKVFSLAKMDLEPKALKILQFYKSAGFVDFFPMQFVRRVSIPYTHNRPWYYAEGDIARHHCFAVMSGYSFASVIDFDEIFVPKKRFNLLEMLKEDLVPLNDKYAAFMFSSEIFLTDGSMPIQKNDLFLARHAYRLKTLEPITSNRPKLIYIPKRTVWIEDHFLHAVKQYKTHSVSSKIATFHHYRQACPDYIKCKNRCQDSQNMAGAHGDERSHSPI